MTYMTTRTHAAFIIKRMVFCLVAAFVSDGYTAEADTAQSTESHADYSVTELEAIMKGEVTYKEKKAVVLRWKDTKDGGDSPMTSGCHRALSNIT